MGVASQPASPPVPPSVAVRVTDPDGRPTRLELPTKIIVEGVIRQHAMPAPAPLPVYRPALGGWGVHAAQSTYMGTMGAHTLAQITWQSPVTYYPTETQQNPVYNTMDIATAAITPALGSPEIQEIGIPAGVRAPDPATDQQEVRLYGVKCHLQEFEITSFTARYHLPGVDSSGNTIHTWWQNAMQYTVMGMNSGDSGAALVSAHDNFVIGLHRAGSGYFGYGCPIM